MNLLVFIYINVLLLTFSQKMYEELRVLKTLRHYTNIQVMYLLLT